MPGHRLTALDGGVSLVLGGPSQRADWGITFWGVHGNRGEGGWGLREETEVVRERLVQLVIV